MAEPSDPHGTQPRHGPTYVATFLVAHTQTQPVTLGRSRLICIDGHAGAGKTTLGNAVLHAAREHGTAGLVHLDDVYAGWTGLHDVGDRLARDLVEPLHRGRPGRYHRYDWHAERFAEWVTLPPVDVLVLEGVGSAAPAYRPRITTLVWVDAPRDLRLERGLARDGEKMQPQWTAWMAEEERYFARARTRAHAHLLVDGTGAQPPRAGAGEQRQSSTSR